MDTRMPKMDPELAQRVGLLLNALRVEIREPFDPHRLTNLAADVAATLSRRINEKES